MTSPSATLGPPSPPSPGAARLLVVDDETGISAVLEEFLASQGHQVTVVASGEEAVRRLAEVRPEVVLTDLNLPGMNGLEVMRHARDADAETVVVIITGYASASTAISALRQGAYDYLTKPFDLEDVLQIVERGLSSRRLRLHNRELMEELRLKNEILSRHEHELRERVQVATSQLTSLYEVGKEISANLELQPRLALVCARAASLSGARAAVVYLRRGESDEFFAAAAHGVPLAAAAADATAFVIGEGALGGACAERCAVRAAGAPPGIPDSGSTSVYVAPLVAEGHGLGALALLDPPPAFAAADEQFVAQYASQASIAIRNSQLYEHTKSLDRLKSEFVAVVSHEIRTPLTSIKGAIELLADGHYFANNEQQARLLAIALTNSDRLQLLLNDILDFSKLESASLPMEIGPHALGPVVEQAIAHLRMAIDERRLHVDVPDADPPAVLIDPRRIGQVLTNLLSNAIKFSPVGGRIEIGAATVRSSLRITVRDHGEGIAAHDLHKLFQKFSQVDSSATRKSGGIGLGLVICKGIVEQHGGTIGVDSAPGAGSCFHFTVPLAGARVPAPAAGGGGGGP